MHTLRLLVIQIKLILQSHFKTYDEIYRLIAEILDQRNIVGKVEGMAVYYIITCDNSEAA